MTETTNLFSDPAPDDGLTHDAPSGPAGGDSAAGSSPGQSGAVRSWADGQHAGGARGANGAGPLPTMLLPELQRLAQSLGITGTGRMRKGQLIAAIEERRQLPGSLAGPGEQREVNGNSVKRSVPAGAGTNRPLEQDAMESEGSGQLSMVSEDTAGFGGDRPAPGASAESAAPAMTDARTVPHPRPRWSAAQPTAPARPPAAR